MNPKKNTANSLSEVHSSVDTTVRSSLWKKLFAFFGPAYLVSVGYMDPGNWATDIAGGSRFGYTLIWVLLMSNLMALLLQSLSARLGIVRGRDLAQASKETYPPFVNFILYIFAEIAIAATDLAEVLGMAIGLQLLFGIPLLWGVLITALDTFLLLFLLNIGMRKMEAFIISLVAIIGGAFLLQMVIAQPSLAEISTGFIPSIPDHTALYIAIGIIGATVMPHNLYLHSALVQTRKIDRSISGLKKAIRFNFYDSAIALNLAFFVNAAILILAAAVFYKSGLYDVADIREAHKLLEPILGSSMAPVLFAVALIAAGQSSTLTGTLAGQIVMEGYLNLRIQPWIRRLISRLIVIIPAVLTIVYMGEDSTTDLLILSQVMLSLQLGFAIIPLIHFVSDKTKMGSFAIPAWVKYLSWTTAGIIVALNINLVIEEINIWLQLENNTLIKYLVIPLAFLAGIFLIYITAEPYITKMKKVKLRLPHGAVQGLEKLTAPAYRKIAITIDFSEMDTHTIRHALAQGGKNAEFLLIHIVETAGAMMMGSEIEDFETESDHENLNAYLQQLKEMGYNAVCKLGYGNPKKSIPEIVTAFQADLLVMGAHGHKGLKDLLFGTTVEAVRHKVNIPVLIVRN